MGVLKLPPHNKNYGVVALIRTDNIRCRSSLELLLRDGNVTN